MQKEKETINKIEMMKIFYWLKKFFYSMFILLMIFMCIYMGNNFAGNPPVAIFGIMFFSFGMLIGIYAIAEG